MIVSLHTFSFQLALNRRSSCGTDRSHTRVMQPTHLLQSLPDDELLDRLASLASQARRLESALVAHIAEVDSRRLYAREACPSMFAYCTERLGLSEAEA